MEISYERQMRHNYLIIKAEELQRENYECRMLMANSIEGLLKFRFRQTETGIDFYYEITSRQPLDRVLEGRCIQKEEIVKLILSLEGLLERLESYLLQESQLLLDPQYIYTDLETSQMQFCLVPDRKADFSESMEKLLQYILKKTDHTDRESALLAYRLYQESQREFYGMSDLLKWLSAKETTLKTPSQERNRTETEEEGDFQQKEIEEIERREEPEKENEIYLKRHRKGGLQKTGLAVLGIVLLPAGVWMMMGSRFLERYWPAFAVWYGMWVFAAVIKVVTNHSLKRKSEGDEQTDENKQWELQYTAEQQDFEDWGNEIKEAQELREEDVQPALETRILSVGEGQTGEHCLVSLDKKTEDIRIQYFPFLIGKQSGIVDYALMRDTVSRIHVKIEKTETGYTATDLNSTNGTWVRGTLLQNNETIALNEGDEIYIADSGFRFM